MLDPCVEVHLDIFMKLVLRPSDFNKDWNVPAKFSKIP
jgi:hypothetical protein